MTVFEEIQPALAGLGIIFLVLLTIFVLFWKSLDAKRAPLPFLLGGGISFLVAVLEASVYLWYRFDPNESQFYEAAVREGCLTRYNSTAYVWAGAAILQIIAYVVARRHFAKLSEAH